MAENRSNRGRLQQDADDESRNKRKPFANGRRIPRPVLVGIGILLFAGVGIGIWLVLSARGGTQQPEAPSPTATAPKEKETAPVDEEVDSGDAQISVTTEPLDESDANTKDEEQTPAPTPEEVAAQREAEWQAQQEARKEIRASMPDGKAIDESTEEEYAMYGALNVDKMKDTVTSFVAEWMAMANDLRWDAHSPTLRAMMSKDYVTEHRDDPHVTRLWECMSDTLLLSDGSKQYTGIDEVRVINSIPSPLTYASATVSYEARSAGSSIPGTERIKVVLDRNYQVCEFYPIA